MSTPRLTFLYPYLYRSIRVSESARKTVRLRARNPPQQCANTRGFTRSVGRGERMVQRHGKAVEPLMSLGDKIDAVNASTTEGDEQDAGQEETVKMAEDTGSKPEMGKEPTETELKPPSAAPLSEETQAAEKSPGDEGGVVESSSKDELTSQQPAAEKAEVPTPIETILHMPPPETPEEANAAKPPHLQTPPYVHHFDTYTLVKQVEGGGFTIEQSTTSMKAIRGLLALNLDVAKAGLVSKSGVENETYLFKAACSELKTEIQNNRKKNEETMRRERALLQHEVDILNQKLTQELLTLKDDLKGMFDDRKMDVREEQRAMESKIQELNYMITVKLNSDSKSEVEGLRWVLTRRSVMGILFMAFMVLTSLRYASYKSHEDEIKKKKEAGHKVDEMTEDLPAQGAAEILAAN